MSKYCDNCEFKKKVPFSTLFECRRYGKILNGNPSQVLDECDVREPKPQEQSSNRSEKSKKKDFIEVK